MKALSLLVSLGLFSAQAYALELSAPVYRCSAADKVALEAAVKAELKRLAPRDRTRVRCSHVISVATGGNANTAIGGACTLDGLEYQISCLNEMTGSSASSVRQSPELTEEYEILRLIADQCSGG